MSKYSRFVVLSGILLFMLLFGLACPVTVSADDGNPTPPATEEPVQPPVVTEEPAATEPAVIATEEPVVVEATPSPIAESTEEPDAEPPAAEEGPVDELLEAAGEGTEIVVLDENNNVLPLASRQAVAVVTGVGPIWCPAGVQPGGTGCTAQFASPQALIDDMAANPAAYDEDGIIYFTVDPGGAFVLAPGSGTLDGADFDTIKGSNLTLQGGWSGKNGDTTFAQTNFGASVVQVGDDTNPWAGNLTIKNITIDGAGTTGLVVITEGNINLNKVNSGGNDGDGAYLDNSSGSGSITVTSSTFDGNSSNGIEVYSNGDIAITGVNTNGNGNNGIEAYSAGSITLASVTANGNGEDGAMLDNFLFGGNISVSSSSFGADDGVSGNGATGLFVATNGNVTLTGVTANGNNLDGASIINSFGGKIMIVDSNFDGNAKEEGAGLAILTTGSVVLDGVSASNNENMVGNGIGAFIFAYDVTIQDSVFEGNGYDGLSVNSGDLTIVCSQFRNNGNVVELVGVGVDATDVSGTFTLNDVTFNGNREGDYIYSGTPVMKSGGCAIVKGSKHGKFRTGLPLHIVPVNGGEQIGLDCSIYSGTKLILPNGDRVLLPCPIRDQGSLAGKTQSDLPGPLDGKYGFVSALDAEVIRDDEPLPTLGNSMTIDFVIPDGQQGANLVILRWDAEQAQWVEVPGGVKTSDGRFAVTSKFTGIYVLATK